MDDEFRIAIVLVPLEAGEVGVLEFIVGLLEFQERGVSKESGVVEIGEQGTDGVAYLFAELLVTGVADVFDRYAVAVAGGDFEAEGPFEVDAADRGVADELFEIVFVFDGGGGGVDFPVFCKEGKKRIVLVWGGCTRVSREEWWKRDRGRRRISPVQLLGLDGEFEIDAFFFCEGG
jgi:hypothetical protein